MMSFAELFNQLEPDPWRKDAEFSNEVAGASNELHRAASDQERARILGQWLEKHQPCLFGRIAAKLGLISYCFLTDSDLAQPDNAIRDKIQSDRTAWTREGYRGAKSAFVLVAMSEKIANAAPSPVVKEIAKRLCSLYLLDDCEEDRILYDDIFLEKPGNARVTWKWKTGVNYFSAQGDGRWWTDHRMPGGMAFSVNSVGHMVKSGRLKDYMEQLNADFGVTDGRSPFDHELSAINPCRYRWDGVAALFAGYQARYSGWRYVPSMHATCFQTVDKAVHAHYTCVHTRTRRF